MPIKRYKEFIEKLNEFVNDMKLQIKLPQTGLVRIQ